MKEDGKWQTTDHAITSSVVLYLVLLPRLWSRGLESLLKFSQESVTHPGYKWKTKTKFSSLIKRRNPSRLLPGPAGVVGDGSWNRDRLLPDGFETPHCASLPLTSQKRTSEVELGSLSLPFLTFAPQFLTTWVSITLTYICLWHVSGSHLAHLQTCKHRQTDRQTDTHTHTHIQTSCTSLLKWVKSIFCYTLYISNTDTILRAPSQN